MTADGQSPTPDAVTLHVPRETAHGERRVATTPDAVGRLARLGVEVTVERDAGAAAGLPDAAYADAGARVVDRGDLSDAAVVARVAPPSVEEVERLRPGTVLLTLLAPHRHPDVIEALVAREVSTLALDLVPRISRAQTMDALSSQATIAGYRAAVVAAFSLDKFFPLAMTAAGTIRPARVVVLGAGVAGLQAVATARRLGAVVQVSDVRAAAREEAASLGADFIDVPGADDATGAGGYAREVGADFLTRQREALREPVAAAHAVICTAQVPGRPAPRLLTAELVDGMRRGAVVIDLAAADGGNCELTSTAGTVDHDGVRIIPGHDFPSALPGEASALYARNIAALCALLVADGRVSVDPDDDVVAGALVTHEGRVVSSRVQELVERRA